MYDDKYTVWEAPKTRSVLLDDECVKCGSFDNSFRFHDWCDLDNAEHLHYTCYTCGYAWAGQTIEQMRSESGYFRSYDDLTYRSLVDDQIWQDEEDAEQEWLDSQVESRVDDYEPSLSRYY